MPAMPHEGGGGGEPSLPSLQENHRAATAAEQQAPGRLSARGKTGGTMKSKVYKTAWWLRSHRVINRKQFERVCKRLDGGKR
jgi:hypothetical protein